MARTDTFLPHPSGPAIPGMGTLPVAANSLYPKGTMVGRDANGRAYTYATNDASGNPLMGVSAATYDNRTGSEMGGLDDSESMQVDYGVHGFAISGTTPKPGDRLYVVDNQTVSISDNGGTRGFAGVCSEVRTLNGAVKAFFRAGPENAGMAANASAATTLERLNIFSALVAGAPLAAFSNGASPTPGVELTDSEVCSVRWNNNATLTPIDMTVYLPAPQDPAAPAVLHLLCSKTGATLADATTFTVGAFRVAVGDLHDASSDAGGTTSAVVGNAAAKTIQEVTLTLTGANLPDTACLMTLTIQPTNGTLGTDDMCLHAAYITR